MVGLDGILGPGRQLTTWFRVNIVDVIMQVCRDGNFIVRSWVGNLMTCKYGVLYDDRSRNTRRREDAGALKATSRKLLGRA